MKKLWLLPLVASLAVLVACGDFGNSSAERELKERQLPPQGQKNPFPPGYENPNEGNFTEAKMLVNVGVNVIAKGARNFRLQSELLQAKVADYCDALDGAGDVTGRENAARNQWKETMLAYHFVDAVPLGPLTDSGRFLIDNLYAWPLLDQCGIDREVVRLDETKQENTRLIYTTKGLGALEYLLFEGSLQSKCNPAAYPKTAQWAARAAAEKKATRCALAKNLVSDLLDKSRRLDQAWDVNEANFSKTLIDGSRYSNLKEATNALSDALFALEKAKDQRFGKPLGLHKDCSAASGKCPEAAEHTWSGIGLEASAARIRGFQAGFFGSNVAGARAFGFDDFLVSRGHADVAEEIRRDTTRALESVEALIPGGSFQDQINGMDVAACRASTIADRKVPLCSFFLDVRELTTALKVEVLAILSLRAPPDFQGDND